MHSAGEVVHRWLCSPSPHLPAYVRAANAHIDRAEDIETQHFLKSTMEEIDRVIAASAQMELALPKMNERAHAREAIAAYWQREVLPLTDKPREMDIPQRLRDARKQAQRGFTSCGRRLLKWDSKAGLPLLCPDDAREEAMRLSRRVIPHLMKLLEKPGASAHYLCATTPNVAPGELRKGMRALSRRWGAVMRACKGNDPAFPIIGAVCVMESPLGWRGDWHPHLNIIVVCDGYLDYEKLRKRWHWNIEMEKLQGGLEDIKRAFREIIKYSCRAVPEKSDAKAHSEDSDTGRDGRYKRRNRSSARRRNGPQVDALPDSKILGDGVTGIPKSARDAEAAGEECERRQAPPMVEWRGMDALEYWRAHKGFRRTRTYGRLYGLPKPEKLDLSTVRWHGTVNWGGLEKGFFLRSPLLESIPGDKSSTIPLKDRLREHLQRLFGDPDRHKRQLQLMQQAAAAWQTMQKTTH